VLIEYDLCPECGSPVVILFEESTGEESCACLNEECEYGYEVRLDGGDDYITIVGSQRFGYLLAGRPIR